MPQRPLASNGIECRSVGEVQVVAIDFLVLGSEESLSEKRNDCRPLVSSGRRGAAGMQHIPSAIKSCGLQSMIEQDQHKHGYPSSVEVG